MPECLWVFVSGKRGIKLVPSLSLQSNEMPVSLKENADRKKRECMLFRKDEWICRSFKIQWNLPIVDIPNSVHAMNSRQNI